jgi:Transposase and inactivated derivatives, IS30 family
MSRNGGYDRYRAALADENAWARARRPKCCKLANNPRLRQAVAGKLRLDWSPEQIAGWLKRTHPEDECNQVSHETIYRSLFVQTRGVLKKELLSHLDRSARCVAPGRLIRMAIDGGISRISSQSVSDRRRLKIGRCLVIGRRSPVRAEQQLHRDLGRASYALRDVGQGGRQGHPTVVPRSSSRRRSYQRSCISP